MKSFTPLSHCLMISSLDSRKAASSSSLHENGTWGLSSWRKGSMTSDTAKVYAIWFTAPNQDLTSVVERGVGKLLMFSRNSGVGLSPSLVMKNPR